MNLTERTLRKWRKEALEMKQLAINALTPNEWTDRILVLTQELLDQALLKKGDPK